jgi:putative Holliday junction resolvase
MGTIIALDIGEQRIGIARAHTIARLPEPLVTLQNDKFKTELTKLIEAENVERVVVGLPRSMSGRDTAQTEYVRNFIDQLQLTVPVAFQDESVTSIKAEEYLRLHKKEYTKGDIDAAAATLILQDYLEEHPA